MPSEKNLSIRAFHRDKRNARFGETIGGGYIVARRGRDSGRVRMPQWPFEHDSYEGAFDEAVRLAEKYPGKRFVVLNVSSIEIACAGETEDMPAAAADAA